MMGEGRKQGGGSCGPGGKAGGMAAGMHLKDNAKKTPA